MTKKTRKVLHSSACDSWCTPQDFLELVWSLGDITLDPCSNEESIVGARFRFAAGPHGPHRLIDDYIGNDGLPQNWTRLGRGGVVYVNPPYGRDVTDQWIRKCDEEAARGAEIIALVPSRTDTQWYQGCRRKADVEVCGRLKFMGALHPAPFPSSVFYWGPRVDKFCEYFGPLGRLHVEGRDHEQHLKRPPAADGVPCALYHRVSTVDQDPAGAQLELHKAATARGLVVELEVQETGSGANNDRPGLQRVLEAAKRGDVRAVLCWKLDRFGRSALDLLSNLQQLEAAGCRFICTTQGIDLRGASDPMSRLMVQMLGAVAEFERTLIAERTRAGIARARARGAQLGRPPNEHPAELIVRRKAVKKLRRRGWSWSAIAAELKCNVMQAMRAGP